MSGGRKDSAHTTGTVLSAARPPFLVLAPCCVAVGVASSALSLRKAVYSTVPGTRSLWWAHCALVLLAALCSHVSVNAFNEWFDWRSGLDSRTKRTPFSGGSGTLQARPLLASAVLSLAWISLALTTGICTYFLWLRGIALLPIPLLGIALLYAYTPLVTRSPVACLLAPGVGFGPLMIVAAHVGLVGLSGLSVALASSLPVACLVSDLLLLNQLPDVEADRTVGRCNVPIAYGKVVAAAVYAILQSLTYISVGSFVVVGILPWRTLMCWITAPLSIKASFQALRHYNEVTTSEGLLSAMSLNVLVCLFTPLLLALGIFLS